MNERKRHDLHGWHMQCADIRLEQRSLNLKQCAWWPGSGRGALFVRILCTACKVRPNTLKTCAVMEFRISWVTEVKVPAIGSVTMRLCS